MWQLQPPAPEKSNPVLPSNPLEKLRSCQAPLFKNLVGGSTPTPPPLQKGGGAHTMAFICLRKNFSCVWLISMLQKKLQWSINALPTYSMFFDENWNWQVQGVCEMYSCASGTQIQIQLKLGTTILIPSNALMWNNYWWALSVTAFLSKKKWLLIL